MLWEVELKPFTNDLVHRSEHHNGCFFKRDITHLHVHNVEPSLAVCQSYVILCFYSLVFRFEPHVIFGFPL